MMGMIKITYYICGPLSKNQHSSHLVVFQEILFSDLSFVLCLCVEQYNT